MTAWSAPQPARWRRRALLLMTIGAAGCADVASAPEPNRPPQLLGSMPAVTIAAGDSVVIGAAPYFIDPDGDPLRYTAWSSHFSRVWVDAADSLVSIAGLAKGWAVVTVTARDPLGLTAQHAFFATVPNRSPTAEGGIPPQTIAAGDSVSFELAPYFGDPDRDALRYSVAATDESVAVARVLAGRVTLLARRRGTAVVTVTAADPEGLTAEQTFSVTVPNQPPEPTGSIPAQTLAAGDSVELDLPPYFTDPDGDSLRYAAASSDESVAVARGLAGQVTLLGRRRGTALVTVTAADPEGGTAEQTFFVTVPNQPPEPAGSIPAQTVAVGDSVSLGLGARFADPDGDSLRYTAFSSDEAIVGVPVVGGRVTLVGRRRGAALVTVTAADPEGLTAEQTFSVTVPNQPPEPTGSIPAQTLAAGDSVELDLPPYFTDPDGDSLRYAAASSDESVVGAKVRGHVLVLVGGRGGAATVTLTAADPDGGAAEQTFSVTVPNQPPEPAGSIPDTMVTRGHSAAVNAALYFADPDGDPLRYSASSTDETVVGVRVVDSIVALVARRGGGATVTVTATDPGRLIAEQRFFVTVPSRAPEPAGSIPPQTVAVGDVVGVNVARYFTDPDGDPLLYSAVSSDPEVAGARVTGSVVRATGRAVGPAVIIVTAADLEGLTAEQTFSVTVTRPGAANSAPSVLRPVQAQTVEVGDSAVVNAAVHFTDPDGDVLRYSAASSDESVAAATVTGSVVLVEAVAGGTATVTVAAADPGGLSAALDFPVAVPLPNRAPEPTGSVSLQTVPVGDSVLLDASAYFVDPDGDVLEYAVAPLDPRIASVTAAGATVAVFMVARGRTTITVTATDPDGLSGSLDFPVTAPNDAPVARFGGGRLVTLVGQEESAFLRYYFRDPDGDPLAFAIASPPAAGVLALSLAGDTLTSRGVDEGSTAFTLRATDPLGGSVSSTWDADVYHSPYAYLFDSVTLAVGDSITAQLDWYIISDTVLVFSAQSDNPAVARVEVTGPILTVWGVAPGTATIIASGTEPDGASAGIVFSATVTAAGFHGFALPPRGGDANLATHVARRSRRTLR